MFKAYKKFWTHYFKFQGRSTQGDFWWPFACNSFIYLTIMSLYYIFFVFTLSHFLVRVGTGGENRPTEYFLAPWVPFATGVPIYNLSRLIFILLILIPTISLTVRRLRDGGYHWALAFLLLIPFIGWIPILILCAMPSKPDPAYSYGQNSVPPYSTSNQGPYPYPDQFPYQASGQPGANDQRTYQDYPYPQQPYQGMAQAAQPTQTPPNSQYPQNAQGPYSSNSQPAQFGQPVYPDFNPAGQSVNQQFANQNLASADQFAPSPHQGFPQAPVQPIYQDQPAAYNGEQAVSDSASPLGTVTDAGPISENEAQS